MNACCCMTRRLTTYGEQPRSRASHNLTGQFSLPTTSFLYMGTYVRHHTTSTCNRAADCGTSATSVWACYGVYKLRELEWYVTMRATNIYHRLCLEQNNLKVVYWNDSMHAVKNRKLRGR